MTKEERIRSYRDWIKRCSAYRMALAIIGIDKMTVAPKGGSTYRDERAAILAGELFELETDPKIYRLLKELHEDCLDGDDARAVELYLCEMEKILSVPKEEYVAFRLLKEEAYNAWYEAKCASDYSIFEPYLLKLIEGSKKMIGYRAQAESVYDQMLNDYEPGMNTESYDRFFEQVKKRLIPLIHRVNSAKPIDTSFLDQSYSIDSQKQYMTSILNYLHFDSSWGFQSETEHPFTSWTCENDCRTTTKYHDTHVENAILSTVHEVGHATYEHDISSKYDGMILSEGVSCGMHESQSRLFENYLGRTNAFWNANYPLLQKTFEAQLGGISKSEFVNAINAAKPSLIRTQADELTYPVHILIRYEMEKGIFNGTISTQHLNETWNALYKEYLGIDVPCDRDGILQDVHWSDASFGYFPTYALGSAFAAQFMHTMRKQINVDQLLEENHFDEIVAWLKENIHTYGCRYEANEVLAICTGEPFNPDYYFDYLEEKYTNMYHLNEGEEK